MAEGVPASSARRLAAELASLRKEVEALKKGNRQAQLGHSSLETGSLTAGDKNSRHVRISPKGLVQREADGTILTSFGAGSSQGNYLTIVDPANSNVALASISSEGVISASGFQLTGPATLNGESLEGALSNRVLGIQALGAITGNTSSTVSEKGIFEISHNLKAGQLYKLCSSGIVARLGNTGIRVRYTDDGTAPTTSSPLMTTTSIGTDLTGTVSAIYGMDRTYDTKIRILITQVSFSGSTATYLAPPAGGFGMQIWVEDIGQAPRTETGNLPGEEPPVQEYTQTFNATWSRSFNDNGERSTSTTMYQGYYSNGGDHHSMFGFDSSAIQSALDGATVDKVELYLYASNWHHNSGGWVCLGTHDWATMPGFYPTVQADQFHFTLPKPGGQWVDITEFGGQLQSGTTRGFVLDARAHPNDLEYQGALDGSSQTNPPRIRITYTK